MDGMRKNKWNEKDIVGQDDEKSEGVGQAKGYGWFKIQWGEEIN